MLMLSVFDFDQIASLEVLVAVLVGELFVLGVTALDTQVDVTA
jgi:hypothetical protein